MIDRDAFCVYPYLPAELRSFTLTAQSARAATSSSRRTASCSRSSPRRSASTSSASCGRPIDKMGAQREQWDDGNNFLAVAPGVDPRLRAQHHHQPLPHRPGHHRAPGRRRGARPWSRRTTLHDLPHRTRGSALHDPPRPDRTQLPQGARLHHRRVASPARLGRRAQDRQGTRAGAPAAPRRQHRADLREGVDPYPLRLRGRGPRPGRPRHLPRPLRLPPGPQGVRGRHRPRARPDVRRHRVPRVQPDNGRDPGASSPECRSGTD